MKCIYLIRCLALAFIFQASWRATATCSIVLKVMQGKYPPYYQTELPEGVSGLKTMFLFEVAGKDIEVLQKMQEPTHFCYHAIVKDQTVMAYQLTPSDEWQGN